MKKFKDILIEYPILGFLIVFIVLMLAPAILFTNKYQPYLASLICINIIVAAGLNIVKGYCGQVTVGHIGLFAVGSYTAGCMFLYLGTGLFINLPVAIIVAALFGIMFGIPSFRLEGPYLALATVGGAEAIRLIIENGSFFGATYGISNIPQPKIFGISFDEPDKYYYIAMPIMLLSIYFSYSLLKSSTGRAFLAIREDQISAASSGINVKKYKLLAFVISAVFAGAAGAMYAHLPPGYIHPNNYTVIEMVTFLSMVVLGGLGNIWGSIVGAVIITIIYDITRPLYEYQLFIFGFTIIFIILFMPKGIGGFIDKFFIDQRFKKKKSKNDITKN